MTQMQESVKVVGDFTAGGITVASLLGYLPAIAAIVSIVYGVMRIYEWIEKRCDYKCKPHTKKKNKRKK